MVILLEAGAYRVMCKHIQLKQNTWYFRRRIPEDVRKLHRDGSNKPKSQLFFSLKTSDKSVAAKLADGHTRRQDALWRAHREGTGYEADPLLSLATLERAGLKPGDGVQYRGHDAIGSFVDDLVGRSEPDGKRLSPNNQERLTLDILFGGQIPRSLSDAKEKHFELGKGPKNKSGQQQFDRAWSLLMAITGDLTLDNLRREQANEFVSRLVKQGVSGETIKRYLSQVRPVINTAIAEFELSMSNPFIGLVIPNLDEAPRKPRGTYNMNELAAIQRRCREVDDQRRWAIAMLSDTMARLAEVAGLSKDDVFLEAEIPHIRLRSTEYRRLKNKQSQRMVPLVGEALWACRNAMKTNGKFLFPVFAPKGATKAFSANSASAALNKWLRDNKLAGKGQSLHSFRHTMRDRLRNVEAPPDLIDRIGGWKSQGVGEGYGAGHSLEIMNKFMLKAALS